MNLPRFTLPYPGCLDRKMAPGSWDYLAPTSLAPHQLALICCTQGHVSRMVSTVHSVSSDGTVSPSYVCPYGCPFHEMLRLESWSPRELQARTTC